ncbi:MAG TPA: malonyl-CoA decarboxylase [Methylibium sp.]|uniref:malonyl-CoA decarboxylase n=1 Tax=Methylibium sp. TaxID=2067992 RepID=UPI002DBE32ED|nr:malonyl-CoA decarboxylase [Methylibium sp.]HEU4458176.1 malonyl-CoA decarboxylase [Methylibium sp.]
MNTAPGTASAGLRRGRRSAGSSPPAPALDDARRLERIARTSARLLSEPGDANAFVIAGELLAELALLPASQHAALFALLESRFGPDPGAVLEAAQRYAAAPSAAGLIELTLRAEPPRQELLRRLSRVQGGVAAIVALRRSLLAALKTRPELAAVEADFQHLLSSWFNAGFLQMQRVDWGSSAALLERIIEHEAVHAIAGWADLRRRLQPDRRCFAFFHPQLPGEPLIFVEVALLAEMPAAVGPLIDPGSPPGPPADYKVATFYSISNCQPGLKGVSLGNFLIKRVAERLKQELPQLRTFCTLSPMPGFAGWLRRDAARVAGREALPARQRAKLAAADAALVAEFGADLAGLGAGFAPERVSAAGRAAIERLAAHYLARATVTPGGDAVAKFHLNNGARLERLNWAGDCSAKGLRQSLGMMVNYLYNLDAVESQHERFAHGEVVSSRRVARQL